MVNTKKDKSLHEKLCVIIPTFNNDKTLAKVLRETLKISKNIIVINDGSTDKTSNILENFKDEIKIIHHKRNKGKGKSLRNAFNYAKTKKFKYAVTIDSDGQHDPVEINLLINTAQKYPDSIIVGTRNMAQKNIPKKVVMETFFQISGF